MRTGPRVEHRDGIGHVVAFGLAGALVLIRGLDVVLFLCVRIKNHRASQQTSRDGRSSK